VEVTRRRPRAVSVFRRFKSLHAGEGEGGRSFRVENAGVGFSKANKQGKKKLNSQTFERINKLVSGKRGRGKRKAGSNSSEARVVAAKVPLGWKD